MMGMGSIKREIPDVYLDKAYATWRCKGRVDERKPCSNGADAFVIEKCGKIRDSHPYYTISI